MAWYDHISRESSVQYMYDARSTHYDNSWHPRFAGQMVELAKIRPGEHVLDLACGTGLVSYHASTAVGPEGSVTGVDISAGMLAQAGAKKPLHTLQNVTFYNHSIAELDNIEQLASKRFDVITCTSALILLERPGEALKLWVKYLKPGGRLVVDATHPQNQVQGIIFERIGRQLGIPMPYYREWSHKPEDLATLMTEAGLKVDDVLCMSQTSGKSGKTGIEANLYDPFDQRVEQTYEIHDADGMFEGAVDQWVYSGLAGEGVRERAKIVFREEWAKLAGSDGKVNSIDCVFVGIGTRPPQS